MPVFEDNVILGAAGHLFHPSSQPHEAPIAWFPSFRILLEVVASTQPLSSLGHLRKVSRNCSNSFADSLQLSSAVSHLYTQENLHYLFSVLHRVPTKKRKLQWSCVFISGISTWSLDPVAISLLIFPNLFPESSIQKRPLFCFLQEPHHRCPYCCLFLLNTSTSTK